MGPDFKQERHGIGIALRDIQPGEEITLDYKLIEKESWLTQT